MFGIGANGALYGGNGMAGRYIHKRDSVGDDWISVYVDDYYISIVQRESDDEIYDVVLPVAEAIAAAQAILKHFGAGAGPVGKEEW